MKNINYYKLASKLMEHYFSLEKDLKGVIDPTIVELIKIRASQINKCAFCLNMHTVDALKIGETPQRIFLLNAWHETDLFSEKEKLVLELTERVTKLSEQSDFSELRERISKHFSDTEFTYLLLLINQINLWNRLSVTTGKEVDLNYK